MKFSSYTFEVERIVVGSTPSALLYAYCNDLPVLSSNVRLPSFIEVFNADDDLTPFGIDNPTTILETANEPKLIGTLHVDLWRHLLFFLSLAGNIPMSDKCFSLRFEGENVIKAITNNSRFARFRFEEAIVFDDEGLHGLPNKMIKQAEEKYKVVDWMDIKSGMRQKLDYFKTGDDFVDEIFLYPSDRIDGENFSLKDAVAISYLDGGQLQKFEFSDTYVRFKTLKIFKEAGMKGAANGRCTKNPEKTKYYALKIETTQRERYKLERNLYEDTEKIKFNYQSLDDLLKEAPKENSQPRKLQKQLFK
tara:strand:- start:838 stop:1755 length:918 start_codon:yes stop_codon:yes gene_type:complete